LATETQSHGEKLATNFTAQPFGRNQQRMNGSLRKPLMGHGFTRMSRILTDRSVFFP
jgi:hypothetical protein